MDNLHQKSAFFKKSAFFSANFCNISKKEAARKGSLFLVAYSSRDYSAALPSEPSTLIILCL